MIGVDLDRLWADDSDQQAPNLTANGMVWAKRFKLRDELDPESIEITTQKSPPANTKYAAICDLRGARREREREDTGDTQHPASPEPEKAPTAGGLSAVVGSSRWGPRPKVCRHHTLTRARGRGVYGSHQAVAQPTRNLFQPFRMG